jgi:hypothetical protein
MATHESHKLLVEALEAMQAAARAAKVPSTVEKRMHMFVGSAMHWTRSHVDCGLCGEMLHEETLHAHLEAHHGQSVVETKPDAAHPDDSMTEWAASPEGVLSLAFVYPEHPERVVYAFLERIEGLGISISTTGPVAHVLNVSM